MTTRPTGPGDGGSAGRAAGDGAVPLAEPLLPTRSDDDSDRGWGDRASEGEDDRLLREVPPHW